MFKRSQVQERQLGATVIEFVLILPLLVLLLFALVDFSRLGFAQVSLSSASREGARYSSLFSSGLTSTTALNTLVSSAAPQVASIAQLNSAATLTITVASCSATIKDENTSVTVSTAFNWLLPVNLAKIVSPNSKLGQGLTLTSTGVMRCPN